ncbi:MAG: hypothetical protein A3K60_02120 [Euryarchaeota archaeon RBG_19FT_COMBO_56_21]|nr:MAG: hypothetical protein A3K60_02120 [Euryarchaeota archaeon RBG_19FT_COMBO_56_21]
MEVIIMKVDWTMAVWGVAFGIAATVTGMFVLAAIPSGFLAEGFFLLVMGWVLLLVGTAKLVSWLKTMKTRRSRGPEEKE